jgi:Transcriptional regulator, AbiEi antitoxin, Type IV TA system/Transcriptional regulator, AbiEi antitoxin N-terminal domain
MSLQKDDKLNKLLSLLPEGVAAPSHWLAEQGYSRQLVRKYVQGKWLKPLGHGVYARPHSNVSGEGVVLGLQRFAKSAFHVGGVSALNRLGYAQYLPLAGEKVLHLWGRGTVPAWVKAVAWPEVLQFHTVQLFDDAVNAVGVMAAASGVRDWSLQVASPERAIMEVLYTVSDSESSFTHAAELFEGLTSLRPEVVNELLQHCRSIKVKRLFLFMAAKYHYPWVDRITTSKVQLGSGKRVIVKGGKLDKQYLITVPEQFGV